MKTSVTQPLVLCLVGILMLHGCQSIEDSTTRPLRGRRAATADPCGADCTAQNHKVCNEIDVNSYECGCTKDRFESDVSGDCLAVSDKLAEMADMTHLNVSSIVAVTPKQFPVVDISFQNDHDGYETTLKLSYEGVELWSESCAGSICNITNTIKGLTLDCEKMSLVVGRGTPKSAPAFLLAPSMFNVTFDGMTVVNETTIFEGVTTREVKRIATGTYNFTNCGVTTKPANVTKPAIVTKPTSPTIEVKFTNDKSGHEAKLTLSHQGVEVWTDSCNTTECKIAAQIITVDSCSGTSLWLESSSNNSTSSNSTSITVESYVFRSPSVLVATFDGVTVVAEKANVSTGLYYFDCANVQETFAQEEANATKVNETITTMVDQTSIAAYFQNDHVGANATLSLSTTGPSYGPTRALDPSA